MYLFALFFSGILITNTLLVYLELESRMHILNAIAVKQQNITQVHEFQAMKYPVVFC